MLVKRKKKKRNLSLSAVWTTRGPLHTADRQHRVQAEDVHWTSQNSSRCWWTQGCDDGLSFISCLTRRVSSFGRILAGGPFLWEMFCFTSGHSLNWSFFFQIHVKFRGQRGERSSGPYGCLFDSQSNFPCKTYMLNKGFSVIQHSRPLFRRKWKKILGGRKLFVWYIQIHVPSFVLLKTCVPLFNFPGLTL